MDSPKIHLSAEEMQLVQNSHWILTKHDIIEKVYRMLGGLADKMRIITDSLQGHGTMDVFATAPKISKGEQYKRLPYVVLDYPRYFTKEDVFAIRTFFWWSHFFSITLHLKGKYLLQNSGAIQSLISECRGDNYFISMGGDEWNFDLDSQEYKKMTANIKWDKKIAAEIPFLKIAFRANLQQWDAMPATFLKVFEIFLSMAAR